MKSAYELAMERLKKKDADEGVSERALTDEQKTIYALGILVQRSLQQFDLDATELEVIKRSLSDAAAGKPAVDLEEWGPKIQGLAEERGRRAARESVLPVDMDHHGPGEARRLQEPRAGRWHC